MLALAEVVESFKLCLAEIDYHAYEKTSKEWNPQCYRTAVKPL